MATDTEHELDRARAAYREQLQQQPPAVVDLYLAELAYIAAVLAAQDGCVCVCGKPAAVGVP